jgi:Domain of unknown function (DUF4252)
MRKPIPVLTLLGLLLAATAAFAGPPPADPPGSIPFDELGIFPREKLSVEINLGPPLLRLVAAATGKEDPEFSRLINNLREIRVQVFPVTAGDEGSARTRIGRAVSWLEDHGWAATVKVREKDEETFIYLKEADGNIQGLTLLSFQPGAEAVVINIVGRIDPAQLGRLGQELDLPGMHKVPAGKKDDKKP